MPPTRTEQFTIWLREGAPHTLALLPATSQRPWRLLDGEVLLAEIPLPPAVDAGTLFDALQGVTAAHAWQVQACGACIYWHNQDIDPSGSVGRCSWPHPDPPHTSSAVQNVLAAPCAHFAVTAGETAPPPVVPAVPVVPLADTARPWWQRLWRQQPEAAAPSSGRAAGDLVERSGKRPGTIPCLACPGRMANLGAQKCRTHEGDERTFSVWRCRQCLGYYLNDWTDKWVRTDSLEMVDIYYRLAPEEALTCLSMIELANLKQIIPADLQSWAETYLAGRTAVRSEVRRAR